MLQTLEDWLQHAIGRKEDLPPLKSSACVLSGPVGSGRQTVLKVLAQELGCHLKEWDSPTPTLWAEHRHLAGLSEQYTSKLDDFDAAHFQQRTNSAACRTSANDDGTSARAAIAHTPSLPWEARSPASAAIVAIDGNVLFGEIAGPDLCMAFANSDIRGDADLVLFHDG